MQQELKFFEQNKNTIENFRTADEIIEFFAKNNIFINKNFLKNLKLKYNFNNNSTKLNDSQLEEVAGGGPGEKTTIAQRRKREAYNLTVRIPGQLSTEDDLLSPSFHHSTAASPKTDENPEIHRPLAKRARVSESEGISSSGEKQTFGQNQDKIPLITSYGEKDNPYIVTKVLAYEHSNNKHHPTGKPEDRDPSSPSDYYYFPKQ